MSSRICVIGYYDHFNLGDDQYRITFNHLFVNYLQWPATVVFIDCDQIEQTYFTDSDIIVLGGGDVLCSYFLTPLFRVFAKRPNKILAVSVGIPFPEVLLDPAFRRLDAIFLRTRQDLALVARYYSSKRIHYLPDISYLWVQKCPLPTQRQRQVVICLAHPIQHPSYPDAYETFIQSVAQLTHQLVTQGYRIIFIPFDTSPGKNDTHIHQAVCQKVDQPHSIIQVTQSLTPEQVLKWLGESQVCISMRFHGVLFSYYTRTPVIPVYTTRKIHNLVHDLSLPTHIPLVCNDDGIPSEIPPEDIQRIVYWISDYQHINLDPVQWDIELYDALIQMKEYLKQPLQPVVHPDSGSTIVQQTYDTIVSAYGDLSEIKDPRQRQDIVKRVSFLLTRGTIQSKYNHGLLLKMFQKEYDIHSEWNWILKDQTRTAPLTDYTDGRFDLGFINQEDTTGCHRSGWKYVYDHLKTYHNQHSPLRLDLYVDRTFHWDYDVLKQAGVIPYTSSWVGFVHHTFETNFSAYNSTRLLANRDFIQSLKHCKGIFVLSTYLRDQFIQAFIQHRIHNVPVHAIVHPTETNVLTFDYSQWLNNPNPRILHIGGWMRDILRFYQLDIPQSTRMYSGKWWVCQPKKLNISKCILKGIHNSNYIPQTDFQRKLYSFLFQLEQETSTVAPTMVSHGIQNNWYYQFYAQISGWLNSVSYMEHVSNETFDQLLSQNIVFIYLLDASAANTLLECIVRCTPVIINNHPAVVEMLGADYPLYIQHNCTLAEMNHRIRVLLSDSKIIYRAYRHLYHIDKRKFDIQTFVAQFLNIIEDQK